VAQLSTRPRDTAGKMSALFSICNLFKTNIGLGMVAVYGMIQNSNSMYSNLKSLVQLGYNLLHTEGNNLRIIYEDGKDSDK
jgi:hypothetical protein